VEGAGALLRAACVRKTGQGLPNRTRNFTEFQKIAALNLIFFGALTNIGNHNKASSLLDRRREF
jgi:hypothetical protein